MSLVWRAALLLLAAVLCTDADPSSDECEGLMKPIPTTVLDRLSGDWVLVWSVANNQTGISLLAQVSTSHVELRQLSNRTIRFSERNLYNDKNCATYILNMSIPSDPAAADNYTLVMEDATFSQGGVDVPYNDTGAAKFYETCPNCLLVVYRSGTYGDFLMSYRMEGHHRDVQKLKEAESDHKKIADCLGFPLLQTFSYDGVADFCHKKSAPEEEAEQS